MPTFCRHNRFLERCPICSKSLPGQDSSAGPSRRASASRGPAGEKAVRRRAPRGMEVKVRREDRALNDGYSCELLPGVHASADAHRLAEEIAFSSGRLLALAASPPGLYAEARALGREDLELATWICFLIAYISPLQGEAPFAGIALALAGAPEAHAGGELPDLAEIPLGPHSSHDPARGSATLLAYRQWVARAGCPARNESREGAAVDGAAGAGARGGAQANALSGDRSWSAERRFERIFERLALPGFARIGRYEFLLALGRLELYEMRPDSLHLGGARGFSADDPTTLAAKRLFAIGDPLLLERRAAALAEAISVPVETLDLALANWASPPRATRGFPAGICDEEALERAVGALGL
jgi:hypothetical protein